MTAGLVNGSETGTSDFLEVLRTLAHKLSQPLTSLRGSIEVALMGEPDEAEFRQVLTLSLHESQRLADTLEILRDALDVEGPVKGRHRVSWTQCVEQLLGEVELVGRNSPPQLGSNVKSGILVMASPQHLNVATRRLINAAVEAARCNCKVCIELSAAQDAACLSIFEESPLLSAESTGNFQTAFGPETPLLAEIDKWIVQRAAERLGGRLELRNVSETCHCYRLNLPLHVSDGLPDVRN